VASLPHLPSPGTAQGTESAALLRLSDADRDRAVARLNEAVAEGRLTWPEHAERVEAVWAARTEHELIPLVRDLGSVARPVDSAGPPVIAMFSKIVRRPELGRPIRARSLFGAVFLDLSDAPAGEELRVEASSFCGKVVLTVAEDATVIDEGEAILAKRKIFAPGSPGGLVVRITGRSMLGHLRVVAKHYRWW
jgi:hypothetical protein